MPTVGILPSPGGAYAAMDAEPIMSFPRKTGHSPNLRFAPYTEGR
jgi:hypothetical protein